MTVAAIIPAAGRGERFGASTPKALVSLDGVPLVVHAIQAVAAAGALTEIVVVAPEEAVDLFTRAVDDAHGAFPDRVRVTVTIGGRTRQESVQRGLAALSDDVDVVLVHDAARPLVPAAVVESVIDAVVDGAVAVIPVLPVTDTITAVNANGDVEQTLDRSVLRAVQTPQGFRRSELERAHTESAAHGSAESTAATDDAGIVERLGHVVMTVPGSDEAFKVTHPFDLVLAEAVVARRKAGEPS